MQSRTIPVSTMLMCWMALVWAVGCVGTSPAPDYYLLSSIPEDESMQPADTADGSLVVGIGPIAFPDYLDRAQIVSREGQNRVYLSEFNRWAESLEKNFSRVLLENLMMLLKTDHVYFDPWPKAVGVEYRVVARILRFDARTGSDAVLKVQWMLMRESDGEALLVRTSTHTAQPAAPDAESVVAAVNQTLSAFSHSVAEALLEVSKREHGS
jgi:uncharacterized lipoprotein YmbA